MLLTTSMIANEQLNKIDDQDDELRSPGCDASTGEVPNHEFRIDELRDDLSHFVNNVEKISRRVSYTTTVEHNPLFKTYSVDNISYGEGVWRKSLDVGAGKKEGMESTCNDIEKELENMKIDALEILFSSSTLESIRSEGCKGDEEDCQKKDVQEDVETSAEEIKFVFQINKDTEMALQRILHENTEVLKKVNQNYSTLHDSIAVSAAAAESEKRLKEWKLDSLDDQEKENLANLADSSAAINFNPLWSADNELGTLGNAESDVDKPAEESDEFSAHSDGTEETEMNSLEYPDSLIHFHNNSKSLLENSRTRNDNLRDAFDGVHVRAELDSDDCLYIQTGCAYKTDDELEGPDDRHYRLKCKSLDNLNGKSKLKIGLVSRAGKWISISIDNSDLIINNSVVDNHLDSGRLAYQDADKNSSDNEEFAEESEDVIKTATEHRDAEKSFDDSKTDHPCDPYLHLNFSIIPTGKKKKDPIEQYMHQKNILIQNQKGTSEMKELNFNPFPSRPSNRPPKEIGVKLGLYSSTKK